MTPRIPFAGAPSTSDLWQRLDWMLLQNGNVHHCAAPEILRSALDTLEGLGYKSFSADAGTWPNADTMHDSLAATLDFPDYYGHNLAALDDVLQDVAAFERASDEASQGTVLGLFGFPQFLAREPEVAHALLDIWANEARMALVLDHPMLLLVVGSGPFPTRIGGTPVMAVWPQWFDRA
jgi:hypothetical protein